MSTSPLSAQEQARIRRERRQAKVAGAGSSRLSRITATQGSDFRKEEPEAEEQKAIAAGPPAPTVTDDPPEIDISKQFSSFPSRRSVSAHEAAHSVPPTSPEDELRQAMMMDQLFRPRASEPEAPGGEDPLMTLLQQMTGAGGPGAAGMPPGMESMMSGMMGSMGMGGATVVEASTADRWGIWWTILHAISSFALVWWVLSSNETVFDGSEISRTESKDLERSGKPLFWYFAVMELVLQSGRFLLEKGRPPQGSILTTIAGFLPAPFSTFLGTLARYSVFLWTILADIGVVIFALGMVAWWNS